MVHGHSHTPPRQVPGKSTLRVPPLVVGIAPQADVVGVRRTGPAVRCESGGGGPFEPVLQIPRLQLASKGGANQSIRRMSEIAQSNDFTQKFGQILFTPVFFRNLF